MKTQELKIEAPKGFEIDTEKSTFERIVFKEASNKFHKVLAYHNTTEEELDKLYENIPFHVKAYEKEAMLASFYNKGWIPNWEDANERKHYAWFYMDNFRLVLCGLLLLLFWCSCASSVEEWKGFIRSH